MGRPRIKNKDIRSLTEYEVVHALVFGTKSSFRGVVSRRIRNGYRCIGSPFFYKDDNGEIWGIQALVNYAIRQGRKSLDSSSKDNRPDRGPADLSAKKISAPEAKPKPLH
jgi:hypothetical protein